MSPIVNSIIYSQPFYEYTEKVFVAQHAMFILHMSLQKVTFKKGFFIRHPQFILNIAVMHRVLHVVKKYYSNEMYFTYSAFI